MLRTIEDIWALEWLSSDIFGKVVQIKKGVTIDRDKTSINLNENMDSLVPASKISDMPTGWICGQTARDFIQTKTGIGGSMNVQESEEFKTSKFFCKTDFDMKEIKKEEAAYVPLPKFYTFKSREERERILYRNFVNVPSVLPLISLPTNCFLPFSTLLDMAGSPARP